MSEEGRCVWKGRRPGESIAGADGKIDAYLEIPDLMFVAGTLQQRSVDNLLEPPSE